MEFLATLLAFGFVFYVLMRWGCGGRMVHGLHHAPGIPVASVDRDPVCGMHVDPGGGRLAEHSGRVYRFCSDECLQRFQAHPEMYGAEPAPASNRPKEDL